MGVVGSVVSGLAAATVFLEVLCGVEVLEG
jgi:hypothetical protein